MQTNDIHPPRTGLNADPVLYGVAAGLAELFPPVAAPHPSRPELDADAEVGQQEQSASD